MSVLEMPPLPDFLNRRIRNKTQETTLPRTARLKEHEGRTLPDLTAPQPEVASNGPDRDEFLFAVGQLKKHQQEIDEKKAALKKFRNHLKLDRNFNLAMMDLSIKEQAREDGTTIANMRDLKSYCQHMGLPIGHQFMLFDAPQAANGNGAGDLMARAFAEGRERGVKGEFPDEQKWQPLTPEGQEHQRGWSEGQAVHLAKFKALSEALAEADKVEAAKVAKKAAAKAKAAAEAEEAPEEEEEDIGPADEADAEVLPPPEAPARGRAARGTH